MRLALAGLVMAASLVTATSAGAQWVPPFKGNDTGGIVAYAAYPPEEIRNIAFNHCASYGKIAKLTGVQARYGGYVSFACLWQPTVRGAVISTLN
jgi:hypothetical protein